MEEGREIWGGVGEMEEKRQGGREGGREVRVFLEKLRSRRLPVATAKAVML